MKLDSLESVIEDLRAGKPIVLVDDATRENEGHKQTDKKEGQTYLGFHESTTNVGTRMAVQTHGCVQLYRPNCLACL